MRHQLAIKRARVVKPHGIFPCTIVVDDGLVSGIARYEDDVLGEEEIDAQGKFVLPGAIDTHVHLGDYAQSLEADYRTESQAAVTGGVCTLFHHLFHHGSHFDVFFDTCRVAEANSCIDVAYHLAITSDIQIEEIEQYATRLGVRSFKLIMGYTRGKIERVDDGQIIRAFQRIARVEGGIAIVHAENADVIKVYEREMISSGRQDTAAWSDSRPAFAELDTIRRVMSFADETEVTLVIPHLGIGIGSQFIKSQSGRSSRVYVETCGHYLLLDRDQELGVVGKVNPPLRERAQVKEMWERILDGTVDFLGSDHVPYTRSSKGEDLWSALPGMPGATMTLPVLLSEGVWKRRLPLTKVVELSSYRAARVFHLYPRKGALEVGSDADIVVVDMGRRVQITPEVLNSVSDYTPYQGYTCHGWPQITISGGRVIYRDGRIVDREARGRCLCEVKECIGKPFSEFGYGSPPHQ